MTNVSFHLFSAPLYVYANHEVVHSFVHLFVIFCTKIQDSTYLFSYSVFIAVARIGTKVTCREGGCGSCVVALTKQNMSTRKDKTIAVNSV